AIGDAATRNMIYCANTDYSAFAVLAKSKSGNAYIVSNLNLAPQPFTTTWLGTAPAAGLCSGVMGIASPPFAAGYFVNSTNSPNGWESWTGAD
ncbi:hypothetical protein LRY29_00590, partial [Candidatus Saccharibacteria bacterium]|nr:hypothetical protein [Candidatus Saccharibacteria bacterium]